MPSRSPRSTRDIADRDNATYPNGDSKSDANAVMVRMADGHRAMPRYPDGRDFDLCDQEMTGHMSQIRPFRDDFETPRPERNADGT
jgi:hypothetical protein